ncbi:hypothetical protein [Saccharopolyspora halophila]|uniref:hypothetical protein n=1 Tax=Saccharopolyspora halophila TaxID=405551 RepID=UPI0031D8C4FD
MPEDFGTDIRATEQLVRQWQERAAEKAERYGRMQESASSRSRPPRGPATAPCR